MGWLDLSFGAPWILAALVALPALWWLLKVTPPLPRRIAFPPVRLLAGLSDEDQTPARTPWWLLLLRLIAAALLILALADPILGQAAHIPGSGPVLVVIDNGWAAAKDWQRRQDVLGDLLHSAGNRPVALLPTAGNGPQGLLNAAEAARLGQALQPMPWPGDRKVAAEALARLHLPGGTPVYWLSDGIADGGARHLSEKLKAVGPVTLFGPRDLPLALLPMIRDGSGFALDAVRAQAGAPQTVEAAAMGPKGEMLAAAPLSFAAGATQAHGHIALPLDVRNRTARLQIQSEEQTGAVQLLDSGGLERSIGIVSAGAQESEQPLLSDVYYLERALGPYAELHKGTISSLLDQKISVLLLADVGKISGADEDKVDKFVRSGGVLIRFAGEHLLGGADALVPVPLRVGGRYLGSAMAWGQPQHLAPFADDSPFNGLAIPGDITVSRQVLAEPSAELASHSWARLPDGTPLVTARGLGQGWIVLFHVTASPGWSSLPLSGLYVDMLRRLLALSSGTPAHDLAGLTSLAPLSVLDGFGHSTNPGGEVLPIHAADLAKTPISHSHPPGLYGTPGLESALNLASRDTVLAPLPDMGVAMRDYAGARAKPLQPILYAIAMALIALDALVALTLRGLLPPRRRMKAAAAMAALFLFLPHHARANDAQAMLAALDTRLAYVKTGLPEVDGVSRAGLTGLGQVLKERTSYEPKEPVGVDPEHDDLSFFPLLYWPMDPREKNLSPAALARIGDYMRQGGTILFDTRDLTLGAGRGSNSPGEQTLRRLTSGLDMPPLQPVPGDHVLTKAFYLLKTFPGRWEGGQVWVEKLPPGEVDHAPGPAAPARGGDGVSPVIIGGNDWAAAWAVDGQGHFVSEPVPGGDLQREMALRFGVNVVMYCLTGNYKTDQVHAPALLQRLGK